MTAMLYDEEHICKHCQQKTNHIHHCTPVEEAKRYTCKYCGTENVNHRHMCKPKLDLIKYYCVNCGAVGVEANHVCNPVPIDPTLKEHWEGIAEKSETDLLLSCRICGQTVEPPGHYCDVKLPYVCKYCGEEVNKKYHFCKAKVGKAKFDCKTCGRIAVEATDLCAPSRFRDDDE